MSRQALPLRLSGREVRACGWACVNASSTAASSAAALSENCGPLNQSASAPSKDSLGAWWMPGGCRCQKHGTEHATWPSGTWSVTGSGAARAGAPATCTKELLRDCGLDDHRARAPPQRGTHERVSCRPHTAQAVQGSPQAPQAAAFTALVLN